MSILNSDLKWVYNEKFGRHLIATADLEAGSTLLEEQSLLIIPHWDKDQLKCDNCCEDSHTICKECQFFPLCIDCSSHDVFGCNFFQSTAASINKNFLLQNFSIYSVLKLLLHLENLLSPSEIDDWKTIPFDQYRDSEIWQQHENLVVKPIINSKFLDYFPNVLKAKKDKDNQLSDKDFLHRLCLVIDICSFEVASKITAAPLKSMYRIAPRLPHHCVPNTAMAIDNDYKLKIYATVSIKTGEIIYNSYTNPLMDTGHRRQHLLFTRQFYCECNRCQDPTELETHISSIKCKNCILGYAVWKNASWICLNCNSIQNSQDINENIDSIKKEILITTNNNNVEHYETILKKCEKLFHPNHFLILEIKQNLANILRFMVLNAMNEPSKDILKRKLQLCEDLLPVVRAVIPGYSKLYALALYEYLLSFIELTEFDYCNKSITKEIYRLQLHKAQNIIQECQDLLKFEPKNSPEEQLLKRLTKQQQQFSKNL